MLNQQTQNIEFHVVTSLALHGGFDKGPINEAMDYHLKNKSITRIHILTETPIDEIIAALPVLKDARICVTLCQKRPSFKDLFDYSNELGKSANCLVSVMNADVSFQEDNDVKRCFATLAACRRRGHNAVLTIARRDRRDDRFGLYLRDSALPNFLSADCWVFQPPLMPIDVDFFSMGHMNCDLMLAFSLTKSGHVLLNPCVDIAVLHHELDEKTESFYQQENTKKIAQDLMMWHCAKMCVVPYHCYSVLWNRTEWIEQGYLPAPIKDFERKRIYLFVAGLISEQWQQHLLFMVEIISRCNDFDLFVLGENIYELSAELIAKVGKVSRNVYFVQVDSLDDIAANLLTEGQGRHESVAWISDFKFLTAPLLREFYAVIFDIRHFTTVGVINVPVDHSGLQWILKDRYEIDIDERFVFNAAENSEGSCSLVTTLYKSDDYIQGFRKNITALVGYESFAHIILFSQLSEQEQETLTFWRSQHANVILGFFQKDPGLYECWNIGIRLASSEYISNANVDDLRHPLHVSALLECLKQRSHVAIAASAIIAFEKYTANLESIDASQPWFIEDEGEFGMEQLAYLKCDKQNNWMLEPHNLPHSSPVWRKDLHERFGYFDEKRFGTFADWAFWLKVTKAGCKGYLDARPLAYYFINMASHNRRGDKLVQLHKEVEAEFLDALYFRTMESQQGLSIESPSADILDDTSHKWPKKLKLTGLSNTFGKHRNAFNRLIESLLPLHDEKNGIELVPFIERYFVWGDSEGEAASSNPCPIQWDWIGILHVPFDAPKWFEYDVSPESIFKTKLWNDSLPYCRGVICLTEDLRQDLVCWYPDLATLVIKHPTELQVQKFNWTEYEINPRLFQAGDWLRRLQFIYEINAPKHKKIMLMKPHTTEFLRREIEVLGDYRNQSVNVIDFLNNQEYDELLSSSVAVLWLYGTAANNIVIECIARCTPLLVNPLPGVVEYLGADYPLYIRSVEEANSLLQDRDKIRAGYDYLVANEQLREELAYEKFCISIANSSFYTNL